jgi:hypothetical protein
MGALLLTRRAWRARTAAAVLLVLCGPPAFAATRPEGEQAKIDALLERIRTSDATFVRNGVEYDGKKAAAHLKTKLFFAGSRVQTAKDFVLGVASHSEQSGLSYEIRPKQGGTRPLKDWLLENLGELERPAPTRIPTAAPRPPPRSPSARARG